MPKKELTAERSRKLEKLRMRRQAKQRSRLLAKMSRLAKVMAEEFTRGGASPTFFSH